MDSPGMTNHQYLSVVNPINITSIVSAVNKATVTLNELSEIRGNALLLKIYHSLTPCKKCGCFLYPPIMLVAGFGNICGFCINDNISKVAIRDFGLEKVMAMLPIPCRYANKGCKAIYDYDTMLKHLPVCHYRDYRCPLKILEKCMWTGNISDLLYHSLSEHVSFAVHSDSHRVHKDNSCFTTQVNVAGNNEFMKLFYNNKGQFLLRSRYDQENSTSQFVVYYMGPFEKLSRFTYSVYYGTSDNVQALLHCPMLHESEFNETFENSKAISVALQFVSQLENVTTLTVIVKIHNEEIGCNLKDHTNCLICNAPKASSNLQTLPDQSIPSLNEVKQSLCPTCIADFDIMSKAENKARKFMKSKLYSCPLNSYCWTGVYSEIIHHLQNQHAKVKICKNGAKISLKMYVDSVYFVIAYDCIFRVYFKHEEEQKYILCCVHLIGDNYDDRYIYKITLYDRNNANVVFTQKNFCNTSEDLEAFYIPFPYDILEQYSLNRKLRCRCTFKKLSSVVNTQSQNI